MCKAGELDNNIVKRGGDGGKKCKEIIGICEKDPANCHLSRYWD